MHNLPGVGIVGPAGGATEPMICVGLLIVEVVGLTISFLVAVEAVGSTLSLAEVGLSPWGSMLMKVPGGNFLVLVVWVGAISSPEIKNTKFLEYTMNE